MLSVGSWVPCSCPQWGCVCWQRRRLPVLSRKLFLSSQILMVNEEGTLGDEAITVSTRLHFRAYFVHVPVSGPG